MTSFNYFPSLGDVHDRHEQVLLSMFEQNRGTSEIVEDIRRKREILKCQERYWVLIVEVWVNDSAERHTHFVIELGVEERTVALLSIEVIDDKGLVLSDFVSNLLVGMKRENLKCVLLVDLIPQTESIFRITYSRGTYSLNSLWHPCSLSWTPRYCLVRRCTKFTLLPNLTGFPIAALLWVSRCSISLSKF